MRSAFSWLTSPASIPSGCAAPHSPPGQSRPSPPAATGGDIVCAARSETALALLIGDVMGHGPRAARTSAEVTRAFGALARGPGQVQDIARGLHEFLTTAWDDDARALGEEYVTALIISVPLGGGGEATIVSCGHPAPLLLDGARGVITVLDAIPSAPPLGLLDLGDGSLCPVPLRPAAGDRLLLYTDGVTEARDRQGRQFPLAERMAALAGQWPPEAERRHDSAGTGLLKAIQADLLRHTGGFLADDASLLLIDLDGEPSPPQVPSVPPEALPVLLSEAADCQGSFLS